MKAVVYNGPKDVSVNTIDDPRIEKQTDVIIRLTTTNTRECLAIHVDQGIKGEQVVDVMDRLLFERGSPPAKIRVDNVLCWESVAGKCQQVSLRRR